MKGFEAGRRGARKTLWGARWHVARSVDARKLRTMLGARGVQPLHPALKRWAAWITQQAAAAPAAGRDRVSLGLVETHVRIAGRRRYLYRITDEDGRTVDFLLTTRRDRKAAARTLLAATSRRRGGRSSMTAGASRDAAEAGLAAHGGHATGTPGRHASDAAPAAGRHIRPIQRHAQPLRSYVAGILWGLLLAAVLCAAWMILDEAESSRLQARYLAHYAQDLEFSVRPGPAPSVHPAPQGPYEARLGYNRLPAFLQTLGAHGYVVTDQARVSPRFTEVADLGLFPPYREKESAGLTLLDCSRQPLYETRYPERVYERFEAIPPLLVDTLLFIEDRELLDEDHLSRNPALEWKRFSRAIVDQLWRMVDRSHPAAGGSTLATQIEKYRHSPEGRTTSARDKLTQMGSASLRAYLDGENTLAARRRIAVAYLNTVPLSAKAGYGEINSLGDGLWAWYGRDFAEVNRLLLDNPGDAAQLRRKAAVYKEALSLMIAQRRPSHFLAEGKSDLRTLTDSYLRLLASSGVIPAALRDAALPIELQFHEDPGSARPVSFVTRKAVTALRTHLSALLNVPQLYDLDRLDVTATSTLTARVQQAVTEALRGLRDPAAVKARGMQGFRMLSPGDDLDKLTVSFTLYERTDRANVLRVQTDNFDQPFDINEGAKLNLGSTAKLRTLVLYLELIADLHRRYAGKSRPELAAVQTDPKDALTRWALDYLSATPEAGLKDMLEAALERSYSANPSEPFFTGGGLQRFENFDRKEDHQVMPVREAFRHSVNLVFVRLMRDIVHHYIYLTHASTAKLLQDTVDQRRRELLSRFADLEGRAFIYRFYRKYQGKKPDEALESLLEHVRATPRRLAAAHRTIAPQASFGEFSAFLRERLPDASLPESNLRRLYDENSPDRLSLADRGFLAGVHPLELWTVGYMRRNPGATMTQTADASRDERQDVYVWLFKTRHKNAQDKRIQSLLEVEAFLEIGRDWRRLGYPFESLTPSYATSIGASGDRPAALAALVGIILNKGVRLPVARIENVAFAAGTPFEARLEYQPGQPERVLPEEVAEVVRRSLREVVANGTAQRLAGGLVLSDGTKVEVGGKTGTGDHRHEVYGRNSQKIAVRILNRSATFVFFIGERFFGTITAYAQEPYAARFKYTSSLSVQFLKSLGPALTPLIGTRVDSKQSACGGRTTAAWYAATP